MAMTTEEYKAAWMMFGVLRCIQMDLLDKVDPCANEQVDLIRPLVRYALEAANAAWPKGMDPAP